MLGQPGKVVTEQGRGRVRESLGGVDRVVDEDNHPVIAIGHGDGGSNHGVDHPPLQPETHGPP
jgi:hypothetical protein